MLQQEIQERYATISTAGDKARAFVPAPLQLRPPIDWTSELRSKFDHALLALGRLEQLDIVKEFTARKRNRLFSYAGYIDIMNRGTDLPGR